LESSCVRQSGGRKADANFGEARRRIGFVVTEWKVSVARFQSVKYRRITGNIMGSMLLDGINVSSDEFPDLTPREIKND
jgi:hypothetical protein